MYGVAMQIKIFTTTVDRGDLSGTEAGNSVILMWAVVSLGRGRSTLDIAKLEHAGRPTQRSPDWSGTPESRATDF